MFWDAAAAPRGRKQSPTDTVLGDSERRKRGRRGKKNKKRQVLSRVVADRRRRDHRFEITGEIKSALNHAREQGVSEVGQTRLVRGELEVREGVIENKRQKAAFAKSGVFLSFSRGNFREGCFRRSDGRGRAAVRQIGGGEVRDFGAHARELSRRVVELFRVRKKRKGPGLGDGEATDGSETVETVDEGDREKVRGSCRCGGR